MKNTFLYIIVSLMLWSLPQVSVATHIVGGEMNYRCLGNDQYEIKLSVFRDCINGIPFFDDPSRIGIFYYDAALDSFLIDTSVQGGQLINPVIDTTLVDPFLSNPCLVIPPDVCVSTTTYTDTLTLPFRPGGYILSYQRCCRNASILNIVTPEDVGATYTIAITEKALQECNNNAVFNEWPPIYICVDEPINFDHSATDIDGDSLVYKLCTPFEGLTPDAPIVNTGSQPQQEAPPNDTVIWVSPPYSLENMLNGDPLTIDSETGFMTGVPNTIGQFVVGVCVEEYRDGELISITRRDFQYNVGVCGSFTSSFFVPTVSCDGLEVTFDNQSENSNSFYWEFNDPNNPGANSSSLSPVYTYSDTGTYTVMLVAEPTSVTCADTSYGTFSIYEPSLMPDFDFEIMDCDEPYNIAFTDTSQDTVFDLVAWEWVINNAPFSNSMIPPNFTGTNADIPITIELTITNEKGCESTTTQEITPGIDLDFEPRIFTCEILSEIRLEVTEVSNVNSIDYEWFPTSAILADGNTNMPLVDLTSDSVFYFTVTYDNDCTYEDSIIVFNQNVDLMLTASASPDTIFAGASSQLNVMGVDAVSVEWIPNNSLNNSSIFDPVASPEETTEYAAIVTSSDGCMDTIPVILVVLNLICDEPFLFMPNAFTPNGDNENDILYVEGNTIDEMYLAIYDRWGEKVFESRDQSVGWNGTYNDELLEPDVYGYYLTIKCLNGEEFFKKGNVNLIR